MMTVQELFFSVYVRDMERATTFYENAVGAAVDFVANLVLTASSRAFG